MTTIYKYSIPVEDSFVVEMPKDARILSVQVQRDDPQIWAVVDPDLVLQKREFRLLGTGHPFPDEGLWPTFVGTFQMLGGSLVFHLFTR